MKDWKRVAVNLNTTIRETLKVIDNHASQIALVIDDKYRLLGTIMDGDVRRGLYRGAGLDSPVEKLYYRDPITATIDDNPETLHHKMKQ